MFRGMNYVYKVYQEKNFSSAAKKLYISQPALSNSIKRIEERIGAPLFDRSFVPIQLTEIGQAYIEAVEQILGAQEKFAQYLADTQNLKTGKLLIGSGTLFSSYVLPDLIAAYKENYPYVEVDVKEGSTAELKRMLSDGIIDLLVENYALPEPMFAKQPFRQEHMILAVPKSWPINASLLAWQQSIDNIISGDFLGIQYPIVPLEVFRDLPFIFLPPEDDARQRALSLCHLHNFEPNIILTMTQQLTSYNMTCGGLGASFVSDTLVKSTLHHPNVVYYKLDQEYSERSICFYYKLNRYIPKCMEAFLDLARSGG